MTFEDLKAEILNRQKQLELCDKYHAAMVATDRNELIEAAIGLFEWTFQAGVVDDVLLAEFTQLELNAHGIYTQDAVLNDPAGLDGGFLLTGGVPDEATHIWIIGEPVIELNVTGKYNVRILGAANVTINVTGTGFADIKCYDASIVNIYLVNIASCRLECVQQSQVSTTTNDASVVHAIVSDYATLNHVGNNDGYAYLRAYNHAQVWYEQYDAAVVVVKRFNAAVINEPGL